MGTSKLSEKPEICWKGRGLTGDGPISHPGGVAILVDALCDENRYKLRRCAH